MSNFTCPTCGLTNIDCGKAGYKTAREIELYQEPVDYDYIIKNKCPCWFYNGEDDEIIINTLNDILIDARNNMLFFDGLGKKWENCCPVRRDEVTFYEEREDDITDK